MINKCKHTRLIITLHDNTYVKFSECIQAIKNNYKIEPYDIIAGYANKYTLYYILDSRDRVGIDESKLKEFIETYFSKDRGRWFDNVDVKWC